MTAQHLFEVAFSRARDARSPEYRQGVMECLRNKLEGTRLRCPYPLGTSQADAYFAGKDEGLALLARQRADARDFAGKRAA